MKSKCLANPFSAGGGISEYSLITIPSSDINEEYVLLIGGANSYVGKGYFGNVGKFEQLDIVFKFNGTWSPFGQLKKPRFRHSSIYWNGAVYVIGGQPAEAWTEYNYNLGNTTYRTKMEIWNIKDSPDQFNSTENWPELFDWLKPHLFIVSDSFFPDY